jgi:hypothetical protein
MPVQASAYCEAEWGQPFGAAAGLLSGVERYANLRAAQKRGGGAEAPTPLSGLSSFNPADAGGLLSRENFLRMRPLLVFRRWIGYRRVASVGRSGLIDPLENYLKLS